MVTGVQTCALPIWSFIRSSTFFLASSRQAVLKLTVWPCRNSTTFLPTYIETAKDGQKDIYYISGPSREAIEQNPHLEIFRAKGLEVLYLYEPIDEFVMDSLRKFKDFEFKSTENADIDSLEKFADAGENAPKSQELSDEEAKDMDRFLKRVKEILKSSGSSWGSSAACPTP